MNQPSSVRTIVELEDIRKQYGSQVHALDGVDLKVALSERVAIMGPSGSGKSTLLHLACGLDEPSSGVVRVDGVNLSDLDDDARTRLRREKIGMIFQTFNLLPTLTAIENISLPLRLNGVGWKDSATQAEAMIERVGCETAASTDPTSFRAANASGWRSLAR